MNGPTSDLLRQYETCGPDGYPWPWHRGVVYIDTGPYLLERDLAFRTDQHSVGIKDVIRDRAGHRCLRCGHPYPPGIAKDYPRGEWTPCDEQCTHGPPARWRVSPERQWREFTHILPVGETLTDEGPLGPTRRFETQAHWRILTVHHLDSDKLNCRWWNLAALCQRCHLRMQRTVVMGRVYNFEHSEWFKPFAAGFYAWKYLGEDLGREETLARLPELLALEHRFTQETIL